MSNAEESQVEGAIVLSERYKYTEEQVEAALRECGGLVPCTARALGCSRQTVRNYMALFPPLARLQRELRRQHDSPASRERRIKARLERLVAIPSEDIFVAGERRYLTVAFVASALGMTRQTVTNWCKKGAVFVGVAQLPEYKGTYLIPFEEVEAAIQADDFPRAGHPGSQRTRHRRNGSGSH